MALKLGERIVRLTKIAKMRDEKIEVGDYLMMEEIANLQDKLLSNELRIVFDARTAMKCRMNDFVAWVHKVHTGRPLTDKYIRENYLLICTGIAYNIQEMVNE